MTVLDINEQLKTNKQTSTNIFSKLFLASDVCVSFSTASGLLALILMTVLVCLIFSILLCYRHQTVKLKFSH
uniref:Uncharacterized protein n=1 Tax=Caenorhabditis japonica TaxID=281687 RepID=A0A8R1ECZ6_CAEJA